MTSSTGSPSSSPSTAPRSSARPLSADGLATAQWPFVAGLVVLAAATLMLCLGTSISVLVAGRVLQGVSGAVVWTVGFAVLVDAVGQKNIGQAMGWVSISYNVGILVAPILGGVVYARVGYYAVF